MLNAEALAHQVIKAKLLGRKVVKELAKRGAFGHHAYCVAQPLTWFKGIITDDIRPANLKHGRYETHDTIFRPSIIETEITPRVVNKTVTVIDGWIDEDIFGRHHIRVIEYARDLWRDIKRPTHPHFDSYDPEDREDGVEAERAKNLLMRCRRLVGRIDWSIFENVIRWNEPIGIPGSRYAAVTQRHTAAAQEVVASVADRIVKARIL